jgi:hypothetical protein
MNSILINEYHSSLNFFRSFGFPGTFQIHFLCGQSQVKMKKGASPVGAIGENGAAAGAGRGAGVGVGSRAVGGVATNGARGHVGVGMVADLRSSLTRSYEVSEPPESMTAISC